MKEQLRAALSGPRARLKPALAFVRAHPFWVECASVTVLGLVAAFSVGHAALARTAVLEARAADLERATVRLERLRSELKPARAEESIAWRESERTLNSLGSDAARALSVARLIAQRAEEVGISGVRIRLLAADSIAPGEPAELAGWTVEPSGEGLSVEFEGDVGDLIGLLGALPPQAAVEKLEMTPRGEVLAARIVLLTRRMEPRE